MALQTIQTGDCIPSPREPTSALFGQVLNASGEKASAIYKVTKTGTLETIGFRVGNVSNSQTLRISAQTVSGGNATGSAYGGMVAVTLASPVADTFYTVTLGTSASATVNEEVAIVIEFDSTVGDLEIDYINTGRQGFPYIALYTGSWTKGDDIPAIAIGYDDGSYENTGMLPYESIVTVAFNSGDTPDERALRFSFPYPCRVSGFWIAIDTNQNAFDVVLYEGTTVKETVSFPAGAYGSIAAEIMFGRFDAGVLITKDTEYFLAVKPGASDVGLREFTVDAAAIMDSFDGGQNIYFGSRTDAGAWSTDTVRRPQMGVYIDQLDDGVGGAGGGVSKLVGQGGGLVG